MSVYGAMFRSVFLPAYEAGIRRRPTLRLLRHLETTQWSSLDELLATQTRDLKRLLEHAHAHVPWYRARFDALGAHPNDFRSLEDLTKLPLLTRAEARDAGDTRK